MNFLNDGDGPAPLVSCIVPAFNSERYLSKTLDSILAQTWRPIEVIVVDDGSTDGTADVIAHYGSQVSNIRQANAGPSAARNRGIDAATGEFVAFLDSDDLWHPEKLTLQMARFDARPELEMCLAHLENFWGEAPGDGTPAPAGHPLVGPIAAYSPVTFLGRRALFDKIGGFDNRLRQSEDTDWFLRAAEQKVVSEMLPDVVTFRRFHDDNVTRNLVARHEFMLQAVRASVLRRRGERAAD